jgi:hypothetical protein
VTMAGERKDYMRLMQWAVAKMTSRQAALCFQQWWATSKDLSAEQLLLYR